MRILPWGKARVVTMVLPAILATLNLWIARDLFFVEFTRNTGSIESSFIALAAYITRNWGDLSWFPLWFGGTPFHNVYQPAFPVSVAALAMLSGLTAQRAYHILTAGAYAMGPVTLFVFCLHVTNSKWYAFGAGLMYSLVSPSAIVSRAILDDLGSPFHPRRFQTTVAYGESAHIAALTLLPLAMFFIYRAVIDRRARHFPLACLAAAAIALTNWPGTIGLAMAIAAFCLSEAGERRLDWKRLFTIAGIAYLIVCRWIPPSTIFLVPQNAQQSENSPFRFLHLLALMASLLSLTALHIVLRRAKTAPFLRFTIYFTLLASSVTLGRLWFHVNLLPQGHRFHIEMEMGIAMTACYLVKLALEQCSPRVRAACGVILVFLAVPLAVSDRRYAHRLSASQNMRATSEYKMSQEFKRLRPRDRVFAPANISLWMNLWTDTPQMSGCCDQGVPDYGHRVADYTSYTGQNAGTRDAETSLAWLRAYGATAVGVDGSRSTEPIKPFWNPRKFEGKLPVLWRDNDDVIYDIPSRHRSLAHVIPESAIITRVPGNGLDIEQLERYVHALEDPAMPEAHYRSTSRHSAEITAFLRPGQVLALQVSYDAGWHAAMDGRARPILRDKLGQMEIQTGCDGPCVIQLFYDGGREARLMAVLQGFGLAGLFAAPMVLAGRAENKLRRFIRFKS